MVDKEQFTSGVAGNNNVSTVTTAHSSTKNRRVEHKEGDVLKLVEIVQSLCTNVEADTTRSE